MRVLERLMNEEEDREADIVVVGRARITYTSKVE